MQESKVLGHFIYLKGKKSRVRKRGKGFENKYNRTEHVKKFKELKKMRLIIKN